MRRVIKGPRPGNHVNIPELKGYVEQGLLTPLRFLEYLPEYSLSHRVVLAVTRYGYLYVEELLGTRAYQLTLAQGPEPAPGDRQGHKDWYWYRYQESWEHIPRISDKGIAELIAALASWKEMKRQQKGKGVADHLRVPI